MSKRRAFFADLQFTTGNCLMLNRLAPFLAMASGKTPPCFKEKCGSEKLALTRHSCT